jgi:parallel beta-helix repeat protein
VRIIVTGIVLTFLFVSMLMLAINIKPVRADGTIYINADGSITPPTAPISTIDNVVYTFTGNINSAIVVERDSIVIDGNGYRVRGAGNGTGIDLTGRTGVTVHNAQIETFEIGISLNYSSGNTIWGNNVTNNSDGIYLIFSSGNTISGNNVTANTVFGITLYLSSNNRLAGNIMANNTYNLWVPWEGGGSLSDYVNNVDTSNTVDGKPVYYWIDKQDMTVPSDAGCVILVQCARMTVQGLNLKNNGIGVRLSFTTNSKVTDNNLVNNYRGIVVDSSSSNNISGNNMTNNIFGIRLFSSSTSNTVSGNNMTNNNYGVDIILSSGNMIYHNNFIGNNQQVSSDGSPNAWDNGYPSGGNHWSNYTGADLYSGPYQNETGSDGIGDITHVIDANNKDHYPLINPYHTSSLSLAKTVVVQGFALGLYFAGANYGNYPETFNVTVYANTTSIASQNVTLTSENSTNITFTWNTTDFAYGNYAVWASARPVTGEIDTANDNCTGGMITVTIPGDIDGNFKVQLADLVTLAKAYGSKPGDSNWNPNADIDGNGVVGLSDLVILARHYGQHYP